jgi:hypothetical protein
VFSFKTGRETVDENFNFRLAFGLFDTSLTPVTKPPDLHRFGTWSVRLENRFYDPVTSSIAFVTKDLNYHECTLDDAL